MNMGRKREARTSTIVSDESCQINDRKDMEYQKLNIKAGRTGLTGVMAVACLAEYEGCGLGAKGNFDKGGKSYRQFVLLTCYG